jgi:hypothetical protein
LALPLGPGCYPIDAYGIVAVGLSLDVLVDLAEHLFGANPAAIARALDAAAIVLGSWTIARLLDAIDWQALCLADLVMRPPPRAYNDDGPSVDDWRSDRVCVSL